MLDPRLIKESFTVVEPVADKVAGYFYARLFLENPGVREMFPPAMDMQRERLLGAIIRIAHSFLAREVIPDATAAKLDGDYHGSACFRACSSR